MEKKRKSTNSKAIEVIAKKMAGLHLSKSDISVLINSILSASISEHEIAQFLISVQKYGMSFNEIFWLTDAMTHTGEIMTWGNKIVGDKHCIGGIAGNRTSPIVVAICAAAGIIMPKTSSRSITSAAGTADTVETVAKVDFSPKDIHRIVDKAGACLVWGGSLGLVPLDDMMIRIERDLHLNPVPQLLASIFSKKLSAGSTHILIDIPYGPSAKVTKSKALNLKKYFLLLGKAFKRNVRVVLTDGSQPIGNGIGPVLEMFDVLRVLRRENSPQDLEKKSIMLAGQLLEITGKAKPGKGERYALDLLDSRLALAAFDRIIEAQGKKEPVLHKVFSYNLFASRSGKIKQIDNKQINDLAKELGCPFQKSSGIYLHKHVGDKVTKNEPIMTLYSESHVNLQKGKSFLGKNNPFIIS
jgi:thymidine phosphorylase